MVTSVSAMRRIVLACLGLVAAVGALAFGGQVAAGPQPVPPDTSTTVLDPNASTTTTLALPLGPLIIIPAGCTNPVPAFSVFTGTITAIDDPDQPTTARFRIDRQLYGNLGPYLIANETDVLYGPEARFLEVGQAYIVGVRADEATGRLVSTVREQAPLFGGDAVIGLDDGDTECPRIEDPVRTFLADGASVDTGVLAPLDGEGDALLWAILKPLLLALVALLALVLLKHAVFALGRALRDLVEASSAPKPPASPRHPSRPAPRRRAQPS